MTGSLLRYEDVTFCYRNATTPALSGFSLDVQRGEVVVLMGPSGAGKTTACRAANGLIPALYSGQLQNHVWAGEKYRTTEHDVPFLSRIVGVVFQNPETQLLMPTVEEEISFGPCNYGVLREEVHRRVTALLDLTRLEWARKRNPHSLSGGQKQAVALASVLAIEPEVLVLDEPTSNIDPMGTREILRLLRCLADEKRCALVLVEHKIEALASMADRLVIMDQGRIVRAGSPRSVLEDVETIEALGLRVPAVTSLCARLRARGARIARLPITLEEACGTLAPLLRRGTEHAGRGRSPGTGGQGGPILQIDRLVYRYPDGTPALRGMSLEVRAGEMLAVVGQNGSGKTTLMKHLNGLLKPHEGRVLVSGMDTRERSIAELSRVVGYVYQDPSAQLFERTVRDEIAFGTRNQKMPAAEVAERVEETAEQLKITHLLGQNPFLLSQWERQRVALAAIMAMRPRVLVLDEPTTGQDFRRAQEIMALCVAMRQRGTTVIMVTHDMDLVARYAERVVVLKHGAVLADGPVREILFQVDVLEQSSLEPPQMARLGRALGVPFAFLTVEEATAGIGALLET